MTRVEMLIKMYAMYGIHGTVTQEFVKLMKNPDIKDRHLERIVKIHEEKKAD